MKSPTLPTPAAVASKFSGILRQWLSDSEIAEAIERNAAETDKSICHLHDFCDANVAMLEALQSFKLDGTDIYEDDDLMRLWSDAWALAAKSGFKS